mmetsp:Transcript_22215/g.69701  ORF Transcript_22215/g.69701 Transcript_22215/m.69701 type:complete len:380 (-) Transcript_22215:411-1550(-)
MTSSDAGSSYVGLRAAPTGPCAVRAAALAGGGPVAKVLGWLFGGGAAGPCSSALWRLFGRDAAFGAAPLPLLPLNLLLLFLHGAQAVLQPPVRGLQHADKSGEDEQRYEEAQPLVYCGTDVLGVQLQVGRRARRQRKTRGHVPPRRVRHHLRPRNDAVHVRELEVGLVPDHPDAAVGGVRILPVVHRIVHQLRLGAQEVDDHDADQRSVRQPLPVDAELERLDGRQQPVDAVRERHPRQPPQEGADAVAPQVRPERAGDLDRDVELGRLPEEGEVPVLRDGEQVREDDARGEHAALDLGEATEGRVRPADAVPLRAGAEDEDRNGRAARNHDEPSDGHAHPALPAGPQALHARGPGGVSPGVLQDGVGDHDDCEQVHPA